MRFGVLGRLSACDHEGLDLPIPAARQRAVLAALLLRANRVVSVDELIDAVWDGIGPGGAHATVRSYIQRLRSALGVEGRARIVTREPGYLIRVDADELDLHLARRLAGDVEAALAEERWELARSDAARALGLWRDAPLLDVASRVLHDAWDPTFDELWLQLTERRIEAELQLGLAESLLSQLADLVRRHPTRERLRGLLMTALARSGRRADALAAFLEARAALVEHAGIEPGEELRALHQQILADADLRPARTARTTPTPQPGRAGVCQLPADTRLFTGRAEELEVLAAAEQSSESVVVVAVDGMGGSGKTALVVHAAHRLRAVFPDGVLFLDLHGHTPGLDPLGADEALDALLRSLGLASGHIPHDPAERAALYRTRLDGSRALIILDNAASAAQIRPLLPGAGACRVWVTSRRRLTGLDEATWLSLETLREPQALDLLRAVAGPGRIEADDPDATRLVALCGRLPLAVRTVAARLRAHRGLRTQDLLGRLRDEGTRLGRLSDGSDEGRDLAGIFASSYIALPAEEQRLFRLLGLVPGPDFDPLAAASLAGIDPDRADHLLESLLDHNLLIQHEAGRYRFHDLVRLYARSLPGVETGARDQLVEHYLRRTEAADRHFRRHTRPERIRTTSPDTPAPAERSAAQAWLRLEQNNLLAAAHADRSRAVALACALSAFLQEDGSWDQLLDLLRVAAGAAREIGDEPGEADVRWELGRVLNLLDQHPAAVEELECSLRIYQALGDRLGMANSLWELGRSRGQLEQVAAATALHEQALALFRELGDGLGEANVLWGLGSMAWMRYELASAEAYYAQALAGFRRLGHRLNEFDALIGLGVARWSRGEMSAAIDVQESALELARALGNRVSEAGALMDLGRTRIDAGALDTAAEVLDEALSLFKELGLHARAGRVLTEVGRLQLARGEVSLATETLGRSVAQAREHGTRLDEAYALIPLGAARLDAGDVAGAFTALSHSRELGVSLHQPLVDARASIELARAHLAIGSTAEAIAVLQHAGAIYQVTNNPWGLNLVRAGLSACPGPEPAPGWLQASHGGL